MELHAPKGSTKKKIIVGRGNSARRGRTSGKGNNGQNARSGGGVRPGFEGGQMPLYRRVARRGFSNYPFKKEYLPVNLELIEKKFADGETVSLETLKEKKLVKGKNVAVKILANGEITKKLTFQVDHVSSAAKEKIEKAGGTVAVAAQEKSEKNAEEKGE
ncbi:50S ribosomal protein L15 [Marispirochaeta aestuarii]|uniref:Large ribosomal subunit protein uL15 n=1 Tax=Marispirochaeta aestuarii TaxID=1963862 RepID=A0A1Y1S3J5_9SPIO|nr:50S ribosomal protein L15 [Marispirochaeta aestuarii]ORC38225.1 50S ribosomal protein L15 [Marispirochaeta aestuarii]